ncbi:MAG: lytic transglycosylase domain-containing protein [Candidatus Uhrbacteria bacterium]|nr:lytic transglycosylase domain-containing protein [Candidatus Uhrbacteria bacterium]
MKIRIFLAFMMFWTIACADSCGLGKSNSAEDTVSNSEPTDEDLLIFDIEQTFFEFSERPQRKKVYEACEKLRPTFQKAALLVGYEVDFVMGMAMVESECRVGARGSKGEVGLMQIRSGALEDFHSEAAEYLGVKPSKVDRAKALHNVVLGLVTLRHKEQIGNMDSVLEFSHALQAYNQGYSGYKSDMLVYFGWEEGDIFPFILDVQKKAEQRKYAQMVLAASAEIRVIARGVDTLERDFLNPIDIAGWYRLPNLPKSPPEPEQ